MWPAAMQIYWNKRKFGTPTGLVWYSNMAAGSLFWYTNMADVTSCENDLYLFRVGHWGRTKTRVKMMYYSVMTQANLNQEIPSAPVRSRTYNLPITSSDALPLSYRRLVGAKAIKLGSYSSTNIGGRC